MRKYIFVTGGAVSGAGKTLLAASIGLLLSRRGFKVVCKKLSPYINVSLGALNPTSGGEIFVASDGSEADLSLGFYERFVGEKTTRASFLTAGSVYWSVINKERMGDFLGEAATVSSHVADEINRFVLSGDSDIVITEVGGSVGDIESVHFLDAVGKLYEGKTSENVMFVHLENLPDNAAEEERLVPLSRSVAALLERGIQPDVVLCRTEKPMDSSLIDKISIFCNLQKEAVIECQRSEPVYEMPLLLEKSGLLHFTLKKLSLQDFRPKLDAWKELVSKAKKAEAEIKIAVVGKYASLRGAYQSLNEALECAAFSEGVRASVKWIPSDELNEKNIDEQLSSIGGIVLPDGKGRSGADGVLLAAGYARKNDIPLFAIGQGMHMAVIELASSVLGLKGAGSQEIGETAYPVVTEAKERSGEEKIKIMRGTKTFSAYGRELFTERCRHKYIVNGAYREKLEEAGMYFVGSSAENEFCEIVEMPEKRFFIGVQFNPEFSSSPEKIHPLFAEFIREIKRGM